MPAYCKYDVDREGEDTIIEFDCKDCPYSPSIEENPQCMKAVLRAIGENDAATKIVLRKTRDYEYDFHQTVMLFEIVNLFTRLNKDKELMSFLNLAPSAEQPIQEVMDFFLRFKKIITDSLLEDPIGSFVQLTRLKREVSILLRKTTDENKKQFLEQLVGELEEVIEKLKKTRMIFAALPYLAGLKKGERDVYYKIFSPSVKPNFMYTKLMASYPEGGNPIDSYTLKDGTQITIFEFPDSVLKMFHLSPPEFSLSEEKYELLDTARNIISEHKPSREDFIDPERMREVFFHIGKGLIEELVNHRGLALKDEEIDELAKILVRYTVGFGLLELVLSDENIQDVVLNSPQGRTCLFINHQKYQDCITNIVPTIDEAESWATKLRMISGRPLDEANPILDTEIQLEDARARVAVISPPLNPTGLGYAFRRHREKPWTLPLFIKTKMINPLAAGLLSFLIDGSRTMLVAGTRSAGKTSLLGSLMTEIMRSVRIITIEDTLELPVSSLRDLGYNIQSMKVAAALTQGSSEVSADEGIRTTLRLGDSALIIGEVRSTEARALYEAMRVGALANVVAGTIHGDSPYGVFDRVVNDLEVPRTSFKATDIIVVANPIRSSDGLHRWRRVTQITEVRKDWENDPQAEKGFVDLMKYNPENDELVATPDLIHGDSEILKSIASNVKEWAGNWDALWQNIELRAKTKMDIVSISDKLKNPELLEAQFVIRANDEFHMICDRITKKRGKLDVDEAYREWEEWLNEESRKDKWRGS
ncbi:MAG: archaeal flagellar protein FlaI [Candidatus Woesearchaeota archaeon]|nr:archaeal flagellar protein FlaI [Candidatus Woesearchaeota archaeon]